MGLGPGTEPVQHGYSSSDPRLIDLSFINLPFVRISSFQVESRPPSVRFRRIWVYSLDANCMTLWTRKFLDWRLCLQGFIQNGWIYELGIISLSLLAPKFQPASYRLGSWGVWHRPAIPCSLSMGPEFLRDLSWCSAVIYFALHLMNGLRISLWCNSPGEHVLQYPHKIISFCF